MSSKTLSKKRKNNSICAKAEKQLRNKVRLPVNVNVLQKISVLSPEKCLNVIKPSLIDLLKSFTYSNGQIRRIQTQWENINLVQSVAEKLNHK
jgi:hypothetical protein